MILAATFSVPAASAATAPYNNTNGIVVLNNNIENRATCDGADVKFSRLRTHLKTQTYMPDIFTVQQVSGKSDIADLASRFKTDHGATYGHEVALDNPPPRTDICAEKQKQTNGVLYRTDRFKFIAKSTWKSDAYRGGTEGTHLMPEVPGSQCENVTWSIQPSRNVNVGVLLYDKRAKRYVAVASIHWPHHTSDGAGNCVAENFREADQALRNLVSANSAPSNTLLIVAGDANQTTAQGVWYPTPGNTSVTRGWWDRARATGYQDPIAQLCGQTVGSAPAPCSAHATVGSRRIDFLLARNTSGFTSARTITAANTGGKYSDHLAQLSIVKY